MVKYHMQGRESKEHNNVDRRNEERCKKERKEMKTMNNTATLKFGGGGSLSVLNWGKEEQEEKCPSSTGMGREGNKENGCEGRQRRRNW
jgi:hypothetical protein